MKLPPTDLNQLVPFKTLRQILEAKSTGVFSVTPDASVFTALQLLAKRDVGALVVLEGDKLVGMFSERDYARKVVLTGKTSAETRVKAIMTENVISVTLDQTVPECMQLMTEKRVRHLPVVEGGRVIGLLSIGDLVKEVLHHHERLLKQLAAERISLLTADPSSY